MNDQRFLVNARALLAYNAVTAGERKAIAAAVAPLRGVPEERWCAAGATRLPSEEPLFFVPVDDSLRAILRPGPDGRPEILDLVREETLRWFREDAGAPHATT
jgi:hypothetical protein